MPMTKEEEMQHWSWSKRYSSCPHHYDSLILNKEIENDGKIHYCEVCEQRVRGPNYSCKKCKSKYYVVHKSCGEPPRTMQHPLHPEHTFELAIEDWVRRCYHCDDIICRPSYQYRCSPCQHYLHKKCALLQPTIKAESHDHPLTLLKRKLSFTCDTCGEESKCMSYFCITCSFMIHTQCALYPLTLKITHHHHPLSLNLYSPQLNQSGNQQICQLCVRKVDTKYTAYYCSSCDFAAHPRCAAKIDIRDETFDPELKYDQPIETHVVGHDDWTDTLAQIVDFKINPGNGKAENVIEIKHIWHEHHLKLSVELENAEKCNGCSQYLSSSYYCCLRCKFFLHKSCAILPRKKLHPLHNHPLTLGPPNKSWNEYDPEIFRCHACLRLCNGLVYSCYDCRFQLDVPCSSITTKFTHKGHEHPLFLLSSGNEHRGKCTSCGKFRGLFIHCADCEFSIDLECATLPLTTKYEHYEEPFILSYTFEDDSGEYYCDICEKKRDPKHWFYYCADLLFSAHPDCILGKYPSIKFGRTYRYDVHEHPLTLVERTTDHPKCHACGESSHSLIFVCVKCDFILDYDCMFKKKDGQMADMAKGKGVKKNPGKTKQSMRNR